MKMMMYGNSQAITDEYQDVSKLKKFRYFTK